jgi:CBS domain-containing protein
VKLRDVLRPEHVVVPLSATTVRQATERLAERLIASGAVGDPQRLNAVIRHTWPEDMVSVGEHAFLPHFRTEAVRGLVAAVGISPTPIHWEKDPHRTARIVIFIVAPVREAALYLQVVGAFARTLSDPTTALALLAAKTADQVMALAALEAVDLPSQLVVRDVMTPQAFTATPTQTLGEIAQLMVQHDIRAMPVVDATGELLGMITHRELLRYLIPDFLHRTKSGEFRALTRSQLQRGTADPRLIPAKEAMARSVLCLSEDQTLADVANLINAKDVDRFPVVRAGVVVGFLTRADLIRRLVAPAPPPSDTPC